MIDPNKYAWGDGRNRQIPIRPRAQEIRPGRDISQIDSEKMEHVSRGKQTETKPQFSHFCGGTWQRCKKES